MLWCCSVEGEVAVRPLPSHSNKSDLAPIGTGGVLSSVSTVLVVSPLPVESLLLCHCKRVLSLPPS